MSTLSEDAQRRSSQRQALLVIGDVLEHQDLPLVTWSIEPLLGFSTINAHLWTPTPENLDVWASFLGGPIKGVRVEHSWQNSTRGVVDGATVIIWCELPYDLAARRKPAVAS